VLYSGLAGLEFGVLVAALFDDSADVNVLAWGAALRGELRVGNQFCCGGSQPQCRKEDPMTWDAIFTREELTLGSYYNTPAPQTDDENCNHA
jgi:hypothetical protein